MPPSSSPASTCCSMNEVAAPTPSPYGPGDLGLRRDREVAPDVGEQGTVGAREVVRILGEASHRPLALEKHRAAVVDLLVARRVRVDEVLDRAVDRSRVLIHTGAKLSCVIVHETCSISPISVLLGEKLRSWSLRTASVAPFRRCYKVRDLGARRDNGRSGHDVSHDGGSGDAPCLLEGARRLCLGRVDAREHDPVAGVKARVA